MRNPALAFFGVLAFITIAAMVVYGVVALDALGIFTGSFFLILSTMALRESGLFSRRDS